MNAVSPATKYVSFGCIAAGAASGGIAAAGYAKWIVITNPVVLKACVVAAVALVVIGILTLVIAALRARGNSVSGLDTDGPKPETKPVVPNETKAGGSASDTKDAERTNAVDTPAPPPAVTPSAADPLPPRSHSSSLSSLPPSSVSTNSGEPLVAALILEDAPPPASTSSAPTAPSLDPTTPSVTNATELSTRSKELEQKRAEARSRRAAQAKRDDLNRNLATEVTARRTRTSSPSRVESQVESHAPSSTWNNLPSDSDNDDEPKQPVRSGGAPIAAVLTTLRNKVSLPSHLSKPPTKPAADSSSGGTFPVDHQPDSDNE